MLPDFQPQTFKSSSTLRIGTIKNSNKQPNSRERTVAEFEIEKVRV